jgi:hypothetical protein
MSGLKMNVLIAVERRMNASATGVMMSNSKKGDYYRLRTKHWLEEKGYEVRTTEHKQRIVRGRKVIYRKTDLFGADLVALGHDQIIFVNSICNQSHINEHINRFLKYPFPETVERWVVLWRPGQRGEPEIYEAKEE